MIAYRSTATQVLEWAQHRSDLLAEANAKLDRLRTDHPDHRVYICRTANGYGVAFAGLGGAEPPGPLWRLDRRRNVWVAHRGSKAGKELQRRLDDITTNVHEMPGMPDTAVDLTSGRWYHPELFFDNSAVWVRWVCGARTVEESDWSRQRFDLNIWEQVPLSSYYAALEASNKETQ